MPGYCGICETHYDCHYTVHEDECPGRKRGVVSGSLEDYYQQTGDTGLVQAPEDFDWNEALRTHDRRRA